MELYIPIDGLKKGRPEIPDSLFLNYQN